MVGRGPGAQLHSTWGLAPSLPSFTAPMIHYLLKSMDDSHCTLPRDFVRCIPQPALASLGQYIPDKNRIFLNSIHANNMKNVQRTVLHELIHAYDHCRVNMDYSSCAHLACTEVRALATATACHTRAWLSHGIPARLDSPTSALQHLPCRAWLTASPALPPPAQIRAANLSNDCKWYTEWGRGQFGMRGQQKVCVKRRAKLSIENTSACAGQDVSQVIGSVFKRCYADTAPFPTTPR